MKKKPKITKFLEERASEDLHLILRGHLYIEHLLDELLERTLENPKELDGMRFSFYQKVKLLLALGKIDKPLSNLLLELNNLRNSFAHKLNFEVDFDMAFHLVKSADMANIDFSDETIFLDYEKSKEWYGVLGILYEVISNTFQELIWMNESVFTQEEISEYLG